MIIRECVRSDEFWLSDFDYWLYKTSDFTERVICLVAEADNGGIVGFILGENTDICGNILLALEVREEYRKQGIASNLIKKYRKMVSESVLIFHHEKLNTFWAKQGFTCGTNLRVSLRED